MLMICSRLKFALFRQMTVDTDHNILFNFTMQPTVRMVLYVRRTLRPTPTLFDFQRIISGDHLHLASPKHHWEEGGRALRHALVNHYLSKGTWHLGLLSDHTTVAYFITEGTPMTNVFLNYRQRRYCWS